MELILWMCSIAQVYLFNNIILLIHTTLFDMLTFMLKTLSKKWARDDINMQNEIRIQIDYNTNGSMHR